MKEAIEKMNAPKTIDTAAVKEAVKAAGTSQYAPNAMRPLIIQKSLDGQRRAINKSQAEDAGLGEAFSQWVYHCRCLYEAAIDYSNSLQTIDEGPNREELWARWRNILRVGEEDALHPNMWVRKADCENLRVLAAESDELHIDGVGFVPTLKGELAFRAKIEIRLACRIAGNATLNDEDRQVLLDMRKAERQIKTANLTLHGNGKTGDEWVPGIQAQIIAAEEALDEMNKSLELAGIKNPAEFTGEKIAAINALKDRKSSAEKKLNRATKTKAALQEKYDAIINRLDAIEG